MVDASTKKSYYIFSDGQIERKDNTLRFTPTGAEPRDLALERIRDIYIMGKAHASQKVLELCGHEGFNIHVFGWYEDYRGTYYPKEQNISGELVVKQVLAYADTDHRLKIAQGFVLGATHSILHNLKYYQQHHNLDLSVPINDIEALKKEIPRTQRIPELMGVEGNIHQLYYECWPVILNDRADFVKRVRNPPDCLVNTLISYLNSMLYTACVSEIYKTPLNPTVSFLHSPGRARFSLSLDVTEVFKPIIVDRLIFKLINKQIITEKDCDENSNCCHLKDKAAQTAASELDKYLDKTVKYPNLNRKVSYRHMMGLECYKLVKDLMGDKPYEPYKISY